MRSLLPNPVLQSNDAHLRGLAVWAVRPVVENKTMPLIKALADDSSRLKIYREGRMAQCSVGQLARELLAAAN